MDTAPKHVARISPALQGETFLRAPSVSIDEVRSNHIAIVGVPHELTKISRPGTGQAPRALREATLMFDFAANDMSGGELVDLDHKRILRYTPDRIVDVGDLSLGGDVAENMETIGSAIETIVRAGAIPVALGGDHFITYPIVTAVASVRPGPLAYLHVDMHLDLADEVPGFGRLSCGSPVRRLVENGSLDPNRVVIFGLDAIQPRPEWEFGREHGIAMVTSSQTHAQGVRRSLETELARVLEGADGLYLSLDIDAVARVYAPGTGNAVGASGLTPAEILEIGRIAAERPLVGVDLVEVSPRWDPTGSTAGLGVALLFEVLWTVIVTEAGALAST